MDNKNTATLAELSVLPALESPDYTILKNPLDIDQFLRTERDYAILNQPGRMPRRRTHFPIMKLLIQKSPTTNQPIKKTLKTVGQRVPMIGWLVAAH